MRERESEGEEERGPQSESIHGESKRERGRERKIETDREREIGVEGIQEKEQRKLLIETEKESGREQRTR